MTSSTPDAPQHDGSDLAALREEIDALKAIPEEELLNPLPKSLEDEEPVPHSTDAIGSEKWDRSVSDETLEN